MTTMLFFPKSHQVKQWSISMKPFVVKEITTNMVSILFVVLFFKASIFLPCKMIFVRSSVVTIGMPQKLSVMAVRMCS